MLFHSFEFISLLLLTVLIFYIFPKARFYTLAIADIVFYGVSGLNYLLLFVTASYITYFCSRRVHSPRGKVYLWIGVLVNVLNLLFFKYTGFLLKNVETVLHMKFPWENALLSHIILPVGISFYTFQLIAYIVDVWRKELEPSKSFVKFWIFISFFGQLIAGPIMRGKDFMPQVESVKETRLKAENLKYGLYWIILGFSKKLIFADMISPIVNDYFKQIAILNTMDCWFAAYLFAFQIYFDFSAYSEIAVGIGHLLGFKLDLNFKSPYISKNPTEFWKRWHITLSSWIRDYLYIPMGGSRKGFPLQCLFLIIAMTISGFWHGAAWTFILWGLYHGLLSVGHKIYVKWQKRVKPIFIKNKLYQGLCIFFFFQLTTIGWVLFRARSLHDAVVMIKKMITFSNMDFNPRYVLYFGFVAFLYVIHVLEYLVLTHGLKVGAVWEKRFPAFVRSAAYVLIFVVLLLFTKTQESSFIYFQF